MKIKSIEILLLISVLIVGCNSNNKYEYVSEQETIELIKNNQINFFKLSYTDESGKPISDSLHQLLKQGKVIRHFYRDENGDQGVRKGLIDNIQEIDKMNRDTIVSILDQCNWPESKEEIESIWYVIQHSGTGKMSYYYPKFKEMVKLDLLEDSLMAKMEDRMLMFNGYPQIYGTQFTGEPRTFHEIKDILRVNERRKSVGLCPIEQKAKSARIYFNWSDHKTTEK